jgi:hypothetical protein
MAAPESTKFQVNFKSPDGTLINLYAANKEELEALLTAAQDFSALIASVSQSFSGVAPAAPVQVSQTPKQVAEQYPFKPAAEPAASHHVCRHGNMRYNEGVSAKGPWKGWMCASPKGTPQSEKCPTIWVR